MTAVEFDGQVAIVTGAAGSIGRAIAVELARRGANLLVNDYGGDSFGRGASDDRVKTVGAELRELGAKVVTSSTPVGTPAAARCIVKCALDAFGRIDMLANNAGITLPGLFTEPTDEQIEAHFRTNLLGPYALLREAWPVMQQQRYGRVLHTSSNAAMGIGANAPYATTKAGLIGLTCDTGVEGREQGIHVNAMMPTAYSRMIEQIPDSRYVQWFHRHFPPAKVAAAAVFLLSRNCRFSGQIFDIGGGRVARVAFATNAGWFDSDITAEKLGEQADALLEMKNPRTLDGQAGAMEFYTSIFPFEDGARASLDIGTVVGAGRSNRG